MTTDSSMRMPARPPEPGPDFYAHPEVVRRALEAGGRTLLDGRYQHWDKLRRKPPPEGLTSAQWWFGVRHARLSGRRSVPLIGTDGVPFNYTLTDFINAAVHPIDLALGGRIGVDERVTNPETRSRYLVSSLVEEAISSSLIEGAVSTRERAREMLRSDQRPRDRGERMILNNYRTMEWLKSIRSESLTPEMLQEIQRRMTEGTLDDDADAGVFRSARHDVAVADPYGFVAFVPPPHTELPGRVQLLCDFANAAVDPAPDGFMHPVVRAIVLHFWLAYDHPFPDGNGRTARALFYWSMLRHGYWMFEYLSISPIILQGNTRYYRAFLETETDHNDLNYFLHYHLEVIARANDALQAFVKRKVAQTQEVGRLLQGDGRLNHRQRGLLAHALRRPGHRYTVKSHQSSNGVSNQTARNDLTDLVRRGLLRESRVGKTRHYAAEADLETRLAGAA